MNALTPIANTSDCLFDVAIQATDFLTDRPRRETAEGVAYYVQAYLEAAIEVWQEVDGFGMSLSSTVVTETRNRMIARAWQEIEARADAYVAEVREGTHCYDRNGRYCVRAEYDTYCNAN